jgi:diguanylate cyclase (GGDEF)-like protein/PAS domain S-box-containing protein
MRALPIAAQSFFARNKLLATHFWHRVETIFGWFGGKRGRVLREGLVARRTAASVAADPALRVDEDLARIMRVGQLWHFVLASRLLAVIGLAGLIGVGKVAGHLTFSIPMTAALLTDLFLFAGHRLVRADPGLIRNRADPFKLIAIALAGVSTLFAAQAVYAIGSLIPNLPTADAVAAVRVGIVLVAAAAAMVSRPTFFAFAIATAVGGTAGTLSVAYGGFSLLFVLLIIIMVRDDQRHRRRELLAKAARASDQERAHNLVRDFEEAGRGWFWETDRQGHLVYISPTVADKLGVAHADLVGRPFTDIIRKRVVSEEREERTLGFSLSSRTPFKDLTVLAASEGEERWWAISGNPIINQLGNFVGFRGSGSDLTEKKKSEREINQLARFDTLTGLANRLHINEMLERGLRNHIGQPQPCAMFLMDLDRFKAVNDTLGHPVGDQLLQQVATRLRGIVADKGQVGRLGGDEFQIVLPQIVQTDQLAAIANKIIQSLAKPFIIDGEQVRIGSSIGIAVSDAEGLPSSALVRNADLALYAAKDAGRGCYRFYSDSMHDDATERKAIEDALRDALGRNELKLLYQPIVDVASERVSGFEALIRWDHPVQGRISPAKFIPIAEESNLIIPIGEWIIRTACEDLAKMGPGYRVAVNVSPRQFANANLPALIVSAVSAAGIRPHQLELEITEGVFLEGNDETVTMFQKLKRTGVRLALDDFGTGYSALGYLKKAPFNKIKIDRSFVQGAADKASMNAAIISSIVSLANALNMETTAEGVETHDELAMIRGLGCSHVQGYIYGKPMELADAITLVQANDGKVEARGFKSARDNRRRIFRTVAVESGGYRYEAIVRNVSARGAMLEGLWNVPPSTAFKVEFSPTMVIDTTARWSQENRMGVEFDHIVDLEVLTGSAPGTSILGPILNERAA